MMKLVAFALTAWGLCCGPLAAADPVPTYFRVLVGQTEAGAVSKGGGKAGGEVTVLPGAVVLVNPARDAEDILRLIDNLKDTYRLASVAPARSQMAVMGVGAPVEVATVDGGPQVDAILTAADSNQATYRISMREGDKVLADSVIAIKQGGRAVVGTRDGQAAPYVFVVIEALPARTESPAKEPKLIHKVMPSYPAAAREAHLDGVVLLEITISPEGQVVAVRPVRGEPAGLTEAAVEAVRQWRYEPPVDASGKAVEATMVVTVRFMLS